MYPVDPTTHTVFFTKKKNLFAVHAWMQTAGVYPRLQDSCKMVANDLAFTTYMQKALRTKQSLATMSRWKLSFMLN